MHQSAMWANEDHTFCPVTRKPSPSVTAFVWREARSEPASGSENPWHHTSSPDRMLARNRSFCSSVPWAMMVGPAIPIPMSPMCSGASDRASSSRTMAESVMGASPPP